jgi:hypothetical protein
MQDEPKSIRVTTPEGESWVEFVDPDDVAEGLVRPGYDVMREVTITILD